MFEYLILFRVCHCKDNYTVCPIQIKLNKPALLIAERWSKFAEGFAEKIAKRCIRTGLCLGGVFLKKF